MSPRDSYSRGLVSTHVQVVWISPVADGRYVAEQAWKRAFLVECPIHPAGGCEVSPHGSYPRVHPAGARVARFRCPVAKVTISLLPSFLAARYSATLDDIEKVVEVVDAGSSMVAAVEVLRPAEAQDAVTSISAMRWVRRRVRAIRDVLLALVTLMPDALGSTPTLAALRAHLGVARVLVALRSIAVGHVYALSPPFGLSPRGRG